MFNLEHEKEICIFGKRKLSEKIRKKVNVQTYKKHLTQTWCFFKCSLDRVLKWSPCSAFRPPAYLCFPRISHSQQNISSHWSMLLGTCKYSCILFPVPGMPLSLSNAKPSPRFKAELVLNYQFTFFCVLHYIPFSLLTFILLVCSTSLVFHYLSISSVQFSSVAQSCPTLCDPMNWSTPGLPVHHQLPEFTQTHIHRVSDAIQPSHPLLSPSPLAPNTSQHQSLFQWVNSSHEVAKGLEFQL